MAADDILDGLSNVGGRIAGTDAERRGAVWLATHLRGGTKRLGRVRLETFWCHPNWAMAGAWHVALALAASLVSVSAPKAGGAMLIVAIVSVILDAHTGRSPGRLLTPYRATQNVVVGRPRPPPARHAAHHRQPRLPPRRSDPSPRAPGSHRSAAFARRTRRPRAGRDGWR